MARRAGGVEVEVSGKDAKLQAAMKRAGQAFRKNEAAMKRQRAAAKRLSKGFTTLRATVAGVASTALTGLFGGGTLKAAVELSKTYTALGAGLKEIAAASHISVEALQELRLVFEADGVSSDKLDKALGRLHKTLGEARDLATYRRAYEALGVDWQRLIEQGADAEQVLMAVADGVQRTGDESQVAAALAQLMGRDWQRFAVVLRRGGKELAAVRKALGEGKILTEAQATALKSLEQAYTDVANVQAKDLAEATAQAATGLENLNSLFEKVETWAKRAALEIGNVAGNLAAIAGIVDGPAAELAKVEDALRTSGKQVEYLEKMLARAEKRGPLGRLLDPDYEETLEKQLAAARQIWLEHYKAMERLRDRIRKRGEVADAPEIETAPSSRAGLSSDAFQRQVLENDKALATAEAKRIANQRAIWELYVKQNRQLAEQVATSRQLAESSLGARLSIGATDFTAAGRSSDAFQRQVRANDAAVREMGEQAKLVEAQWTEAYENIAASAAQAVGDMLLGFRSLEDGVRGIVSSIVSELARIAIVKPLTTAIGGFFGLPGLAGGGDVARGGLVMVGERGAEVVELPAGARVHPSGTGPGGGVTVQIGQLVGTVQSTDGPGVEAALARWSGPMAEAIESQVAQALARPGQVRGAVFGR